MADFSYETIESLAKNAPSLESYEISLMVGAVAGGITLGAREETREEFWLASQIAVNLHELGYHPPFSAGERVWVLWSGRRAWGTITVEYEDGSFGFLWDAKDSRGQSEGTLTADNFNRDPLADPLRTIPNYDPAKA